eukprot:scaffold2188_cov102-Isochrysis_galbana.AAC.14
MIVYSASLASCSIPGVFDAVELMAKNRDGDIVPYFKTGGHRRAARTTLSLGARCSCSTTCFLPTFKPSSSLPCMQTDAPFRHSYRPTPPSLAVFRWTDGGLQADLPKQRLTELFNVNQFIVSQARLPSPPNASSPLPSPPSFRIQA